MSNQTVSLTIEVPQPELAFLTEMLKVSRNRHKNALNLIRDKAVDSALSLASSTVTTDHWKRLNRMSRKLGVSECF